jgi:tetratricopeptide (TPR) repeat protein
LIGHCRATLDAPAYWPFREIARQLAAHPLLRARVDALARQYPDIELLLPELASTARNKTPARMPSAEMRFELCEAFANLLRSLAHARPLRLAIEDLHWADDGSLALLDAVARAARRDPLHVLGTYRPEAVAAGSALSRLVASVSGRDGTLSVQLGPLGETEVAQLIEALRLPESAARAVPQLLRLTGGNALYLHELVQQRLLTKPQPPSLRHIVAERVAGLPVASQGRLAAAAVLGHDFAVSILAAMSGVEPTLVLGELEPVLRAGLLKPNPLRPDRVQFNHALVGDALVASLEAGLRKSLHRAALEALRRDGSSSELAHHAFEAGELVSAAERRQLCEAAGRELFDSLAFDRAVAQLGRALQFVEPADDSRAAAELTLLWARALWHADGSDREVDAAFELAVERARRAGNPALFAEAAIGYAVGGESSVLLRIASLRPRAREQIEEAWRLLQPPAAGSIAYRVAAARVWMSAETSPPEDSEAAARIAVECAPDALDPAEELWLLALRSLAEPERERAYCEEIYERVAGEGIAPHQSIEIVPVLMAAHLRRGQLDGWERAATEIARLSGLLRLPERAGARLSIYAGLPLLVPIMRAVIAGELADALALFWKAVDRVQRLGLTRTAEGDHNALHILLQIHGYLGRTVELEPFVAAMNQRMFWFVELMRAQLALERGDRAAAERHFSPLRASQFQPTIEGRTASIQPETLVRLADVCTRIGTRDDAALLYDLLAPWSRWIVHDGTVICWGSSERALGSLAMQLERWDDAERHFEAGLAKNALLGHRPELARTRWNLAQLRRAQGREAEARTWAASAERNAAEMGMRIMPTS